MLLPIVKSGGTKRYCAYLQRSSAFQTCKMKGMKLWGKSAIVRDQKERIDFGSIENL